MQPAISTQRMARNLPCGEEVGFAGFPNRFRNVGHGLMDRQGLGLEVLHQAEDRADDANHDAQIHQRGAADAAQPVKLERR